MGKILKIIILLSLVVINFYFLNLYIVSENVSIKNRLDKINLKGINNLMIIAHPDDESLWGGVHLSKSDYLVVCVTCGVDRIRQKEFENAINEFENKYIALGYPDKTNNKKDDWSKVYYKIEKDIKDIIDYKNWNIIVTHNPEGEYNHIHHKMINTMVSLNVDKNKLYYFNKYYTNDELDNVNFCMNSISDKELYVKKILLDNYPSQEAIINNHYKNAINEQFISYDSWY